MLDALLHILFIIVPQLTVLTVFILLFINRFELITIDEISYKAKFNGKELKKLFFTVILQSIITIYARRFLLDLILIPLALMVSLFLLILITYKIKKASDTIKLILGIIVGVIIGGIVEGIYSPLFLHSQGMTVHDVYNSFYSDLVTSLPVIIILFIIDIILITKKKSILNISVLKSIGESRVLTVIAIFVLMINIILLSIISVISGNFKVLPGYAVEIQLTILVVLMVFPAINLGGFWILIYSVKYNEALGKRIARDKMIEEISIEKERNRMARDVHDTLGHSLIIIIKLLEVCKLTCKTSPDNIDDKLEEAIRIAREGVKAVRHSITGILTEKLIKTDIVGSINELAYEFQNKTGVIVKVSAQGFEEDISEKYASPLFSVCQEALTNSLRHGKAKNIAIVLRADSKVIRLSVFDDGIGCKDINKGFGLTGMEQRIRELKGTINYKSEKGQGFIINIHVQKDKTCSKLAD